MCLSSHNVLAAIVTLTRGFLCLKQNIPGESSLTNHSCFRLQ